MPSSDVGSTAKVSRVSRIVSFVMLIVTILVVGFFFFHVIQSFLLPLFLAALLAVIFRPFHDWVVARCQGRVALSSALSTLTIMCIVLIPLAGLIALAVHEANQAFRYRSQIREKAIEFRTKAGLQKPFFETIEKIETEFLKLDDLFSQVSIPPVESNQLVDQGREEIKQQLRVLKTQTREACFDLRAEIQKELATKDDERLAELWDSIDSLYRSLASEVGPTDIIGTKRDSDRWLSEQRFLRSLAKRGASSDYILLINDFVQQLDAIDAASPYRRQQLTNAQVSYDTFRTALLGGPIRKWVIELANPSEEQISDWLSMVLSGNAASWLPSITNTATSLITGLLVGLCIMAIGLFYFFMDGPKMIDSFMVLSPMDDRHEKELLQEFDKVSRAVVVATLLSALAQGILGGIGYKIFGLDSVFLLTFLTTVLALVPFVGAAAVWVPCCLWLALVEDSYWRAGMLAVYGFVIISMSDNLIKPWVLQGQSKLHPLLALLSVLGGVQALGPIGILIGPMVVAFLQVLLTIFAREVSSFDAALQRPD